ncbi:MAG: ribosome hibernation-promoting factor, HPF/YfiA family [Sulfurifustis sp.]
MQLTVTGHQMDVTEPLRNYAAEKIGKLQRHFDHMTTGNVVLHVEKNRHLVEATIFAKGITLHAEAADGDMYAAIDSLVDKLDRQVLKHKEKATSHHREDGPLKRLS